MKRFALALGIVVITAVLIGAQGQKPKPLEIWVVDVEGGKAALYVSPTGQTAMRGTIRSRCSASERSALTPSYTSRQIRPL